MNDFRQFYEAVTDIWKLRKKYGGEQLNDEQWQCLTDEGQELHRKHEAVSKDTDLLFRGMFAALQEYYIRKETGK